VVQLYVYIFNLFLWFMYRAFNDKWNMPIRNIIIYFTLMNHSYNYAYQHDSFIHLFILLLWLYLCDCFLMPEKYLLFDRTKKRYLRVPKEIWVFKKKDFSEFLRKSVVYFFQKKDFWDFSRKSVLLSVLLSLQNSAHPLPSPPQIFLKDLRNLFFRKKDFTYFLRKSEVSSF